MYGQGFLIFVWLLDYTLLLMPPGMLKSKYNQEENFYIDGRFWSLISISKRKLQSFEKETKEWFLWLRENGNTWGRRNEKPWKVS